MGEPTTDDGEPGFMIFGLFRRSSSRAVIERLYAAIVEGSRQRALYAELGVPDSFEGRFESLTVHAVLVLRRLRGLESPGPEMAQDLVDTVFRHFDRTMREMGVGDTSVPKRMKRLAEAFLGRSTAYDEALRDGHDALAKALSRNVYNGAREDDALALYVEAGVAHLAQRPLQAFIDGAVTFPDPVDCATERPR